MAAIPAAMTLDRLLENISLTPVAWTVNLSYARPRWSFDERKWEARRYITQRRFTPSFGQTFRKGTPRTARP
jgi:hypothetical protein